MPAPAAATIRELDRTTFARVLPTLLDIYVTAMGYAASTGHARTPLWLNHSQRAGFRCVVAQAPAPDGSHGNGSPGNDSPGNGSPGNGVITGFSYGYRAISGQWWHDQVARGVAHRRRPTDHDGIAALGDYFELTELHVRPTCQGGGLGESLLRALVAPLTTPRVMLSTPEGPSRAWRLYRRLGFDDVLRDFQFTGDPRPFAVLRRDLPLPPDPAPQIHRV